ncbi:hypothetical protein [Halotia branconii]|uniref:Uncharacterized protein n=1 Tax=Halotia branconii CENA392 TaxID=1539056 RepID=A0AAJ6NTG1_9CYAN|nr:hypothetical protein [Halotia branconii]WGV26302.1 hypothetical protein QI031_01955 [Halotia branconii CENA392]
MLTTNELRWFYPGTIPTDIKIWFQQNCLIDRMQPPEEREDQYLYAPKCDYLGIKLRQGRLEIKWRKAEFGEVRLGQYAEGKVEKWAKWMCNDPTGESFQPAMVLENSTWINVHKVRYSQSYKVSSDLSVQQVVTNESNDNGCNVEITNLTIQSNTWWSLAFEAFGKDNLLMDNLKATANLILKTYQGSKLLAANSYAYPYLLGLVCG